MNFGVFDTKRTVHNREVSELGRGEQVEVKLYNFEVSIHVDANTTVIV